MIGRRLLLATACLAALCVPAEAAPCDAAGSSMVELKDCLAGVEQQVEIELLVTWAAVQRNIAGRDFLDPPTHARYAAAADRAQAAWKAWREVECREVTGFDWWGGSGAGVAVRSCMIETTAARVRDLVSRYDLDPAETPISFEMNRP